MFGNSPLLEAEREFLRRSGLSFLREQHDFNEKDKQELYLFRWQKWYMELCKRHRNNTKVIVALVEQDIIKCIQLVDPLIKKVKARLAIDDGEHTMKELNALCSPDELEEFEILYEILTCLRNAPNKTIMHYKVTGLRVENPYDRWP